MKYETLVYLLEEVGLHITNKKWDVGDNGELILKASLGGKSLNNQPSIVDVAVHKDISATGSSLTEITRMLFDLLTTKKIFIGAYNNYTETISWDRANNKFTKRLLTQKELLEMNCSV